MLFDFLHVAAQANCCHLGSRRRTARPGPAAGSVPAGKGLGITKLWGFYQIGWGRLWSCGEGKAQSTVDTCWHPRWQRQIFTGSQAWLEPERTGIKSLMNLLRAARTRARIRFSSGPARGSARPPPPPPHPKGSRMGRSELSESAALCSGGARRGSPRESPARLRRPLWAVWRARRGHWGACLDAGPHLGVHRAVGPPGSPASLEPAPRFPGLEEPLVGKPWAGALAAESWPAAPLRGSPSVSSGLGRCGKPARGHPHHHHPAPLRLLSAPAGTCLSAGGGCFPFTARTPQWRRAAAAAPACVARRRNRQATARKGARQESWRGTACLLFPGICCQSRLQKWSGKTLRWSHQLRIAGKKIQLSPTLGQRTHTHHSNGRRRAGCRKGQGYSLKKKKKKYGPFWVLGAWIKTRGLGGGSLTLEGLRAGEFQASWFTNGRRGSRSAPEGGEQRAVPARWAGASG